jgi:uncharacterized protein YukE
MPRKASSSSRTRPKTASLALSELHIRLAVLEKEHQRLLKQIKKKRTELKNFVEQMRSLATEVFHRGIPSLQKIADLDLEIHSLFDEILTKRKLGKQTQKKIEEVYYNLQFSGIISPKRNQPQDDPELDELFESDEPEDEYSIPPHEGERQQEEQLESENLSTHRTEESRKIRQTFLRLAEIFHPDMVTDTETQMRHTEIMKEINKAYKEGDLARLLEIEQQHEVGELIDDNSEDDVTRKCKRIEQHNELLKRQYENLKRELRQVKRTPEGAMVSDYRKGVKQGADPMGEMLEEVEHQIEMIAQIRDFVQDFKQQKITIKEFLSGPPILHQMRQDMMDELFEQMFEEFDEGIIF